MSHERRTLSVALYVVQNTKQELHGREARFLRCPLYLMWRSWEVEDDIVVKFLVRQRGNADCA